MAVCAGCTSSLDAMTKIFWQDVLVGTVDWLLLVKAAEAKGADVDKRRPLLHDQFGHAGPNRRRNLKAGAAEAGSHIQPLNPRGTIEDRARIWADVIDPCMPTLVFRLLQPWNPTCCLRLCRWNEIRIVGFVIVIGVRGRLRLPMPHSDQGQAFTMRPEIGA